MLRFLFIVADIDTDQPRTGGNDMSAHLYSTRDEYVGFAYAAPNYLRRQQYIDRIPVVAYFPDTDESIGTRSYIGGIGLWHFVDRRYSDVRTYLAESHDLMRRAGTFRDAADRTGDDTFATLAARLDNASEMSYGAAMEIRYNVQ